VTLTREGGEYRLDLRSGGGVVPSLTARSVVLALPPAAASRAARDLDPDLAEDLDGIRSSSVVVAHLGFRTEQVRAPRPGYGFLATGDDGTPVLGIVFSSSVFDDRAPAGRLLFRSILGGSRHPEAIGMDDEALIAASLDLLRTTVGLEGEPEFVDVQRQPDVIPQYEVGHLERMARIDEGVARHPGLALAGHGYRGLGVNESLRQGREAAERIRTALSVLST
jgi:oxygen-dependent protoporphyrinogen oxidase